MNMNCFNNLIQNTSTRSENMEEERFPLRLIHGIPPNIPTPDQSCSSSDTEDHIYETIDDSSEEGEVELISESAHDEYYATVHLHSSDIQDTFSEPEYDYDKPLTRRNVHIHEQRNFRSEDFNLEDPSSSNNKLNDEKEECNVIYDSDASSSFRSVSLDLTFSDSSADTPIRPDILEDMFSSNDDSVPIFRSNESDFSYVSFNYACDTSSNNKPSDEKEECNEIYDIDASSRFRSLSLDITFSDSSDDTPIRPDIFVDMCSSNDDSVSICKSNEGDFSVGYQNHGFDCTTELIADRENSNALSQQISRNVLPSTGSTANASTKETRIDIPKEFVVKSVHPAKLLFDALCMP